MSPHCLLFDLDGTLADTAPELAGAINAMRIEDGLEALPFSQLRPVCSQGARGLVLRSYGVDADDHRFAGLRARFLQHYGNGFVARSQPFEGVSELLGTLEQSGLRWGIVTNKPRAYAEPLVEALGWAQRSAVLIAGDDAAQPKPAPDPLLLACERIALAPADCLYVGDDPRDITAARAARMPNVAVSWGYIEEAPPITGWGADRVCHAPAELLIDPMRSAS
ncbi:phosphoglycolate phosphatase [Algiphilus sp.]|uniref:phosphoglycolate phosphatase n=1 Tax=Algiphilus sp. TaxID=1872431 RepID=UPI003B52C3CA